MICDNHAPIFNDGIVPFPSAAMQLSYPRNYTDNPIQIEYKGVKTSIEYGKEPYIIAHTDNYESMYYILYFKIQSSNINSTENNEYFAECESEEIKENIKYMHSRLVNDSMQWTIFHVSLDHRALATLYQEYESGIKVTEHISNQLQI